MDGGVVVLLLLGGKGLDGAGVAVCVWGGVVLIYRVVKREGLR